MTIEISNGNNATIYKNRFLLRSKGFKFVKRSYGKSFYAKKIESEDEKTKLKQFCLQQGLTFKCIDDKYIRSSDYRKAYMESMKFKHKYTICAYCGLPLKVDKITVDHIIPVDKVQNSNYAKLVLKKLHIDNVNNKKNLVGACRRCNSKKGTKMGSWVIRGFVGKSKVVWGVRWFLRCAVLYVVVTYGVPALVSYIATR